MIIDMHCDLLSHETFSDQDPFVRCSPSQLLSGGVNKQVCAIFTEHSESSPSADKQNQLFFSLPESDKHIQLISFDSDILDKDNNKNSLSLVRSIENASGLGSDYENLRELLNKLIDLFSMGPIAYLGIVWNGRNRFGGGVFDPHKLTTDGKRLLEVMEQLAIPIDLSHCCDRLSDDILDYTLDKLPTMQVLASHSNFREVQNIPRNLTSAHAKEIASRGGVIGLNIVNYFVGSSLKDLQKHIHHAEKIGILDKLVLGTDFFYSDEQKKFFPECSTAKDHPNIHNILRDSLRTEDSENILWRSAQIFLDQTLRRQRGRKKIRLDI
ncbi:Membrane dipeptidase (Peptidase family M19) [Chlamydia poikilotherma]|uniref:Membrane dipeptidase (Peptidase family M19) n=1 Tax=Chlamydia poikilotherma TaxID=1967783 RepID=A0A3B0Q069_9CHLA|nr:membrane dipeptidase [Chlamydia poikilotherma]SYX08995.1 Membrane dipeptidase (Peptidase family M19) [Chlamydia poikilotherma]